MSPADLLARLAGLLVAVVGGVLVLGGFFVPTAGAPGIALLARGAILNVVVAGGAAGVAFLLAGLAVLVDRGRALAVSVGGIVLVAAVALLAVGTNSTQSVLGVGLVALVLLLAGSSVGSGAAA
ncbi:hypothetical protein D3D02_04270 [Halobellus sp. Atlit-38R]|jgi:hypothetical protein|uniref:hypothetical protein n=1 Tax=Halobellus sp. Atlit-38R TaxID=2282131 RepID=UPI000EF269DC|nr:hypothetical protein [Halobellus sp. Atlit-38R]RLM90981.1 hypothetical protein D3D02_04270 [Halobellus sp. Atlit-38R]